MTPTSFAAPVQNGIPHFVFNLRNHQK